VSDSPVPALPSAEGKGRVVRVLLLLAVFSAAVGAGWWFLRSRPRDRALTLARDGQFSAAAPQLESVSAHDPEDVEVAEALARGYLEAGDREKARPHLDRWVRLRPDEANPYRLRMGLHRAAKSFGEAQADGLRLLELKPKDDALVLTVAELSFEAGDFEKAEQLYRRALEDQPQARDARRMLGHTLQARNRPRQAADLFDELLKEQPDDTRAMLARGILAVEMGEPAVAIPLLERVVQLDPGRQRTTRAQLARAYGQAGRSEDARRVTEELNALQEEEVLRKALDSQPDNPEVQVRFARAWLARGMTAAALDLLGRLLDRHPDHRGAHRTLAEYYEKAGQREKAAEHRRRAEGR
jgi:predicted Zn-dependent protease